MLTIGQITLCNVKVLLRVINPQRILTILCSFTDCSQYFKLIGWPETLLFTALINPFSVSMSAVFFLLEKALINPQNSSTKWQTDPVSMSLVKILMYLVAKISDISPKKLLEMKKERTFPNGPKPRLQINADVSLCLLDEQINNWLLTSFFTPKWACICAFLKIF